MTRKRAGLGRIAAKAAGQVDPDAGTLPEVTHKIKVPGDLARDVDMWRGQMALTVRGGRRAYSVQAIGAELFRLLMEDDDLRAKVGDRLAP